MDSFSVRRRRDADVGAVAEILTRQAPESGYPFRWPLPMPIEDFIVRQSELAAWVAVSGGPAGVILGHVSVSSVGADHPALPQWLHATGVGRDQLGSLGALMVDPEARRRGIADALTSTAEQWLHDSGRTPVLEVMPRQRAAIALYRRRGWVGAGTTRSPWLPDHEPDIALFTLIGRAEAGD